MLARSVGFLLQAATCALEAFDLDTVERTAWAASSAAAVPPPPQQAPPPPAEEQQQPPQPAFSAREYLERSRQPPQPPRPAAPAQEWFLLLHNDDVHGKREVAEALASLLRPLNPQLARKYADQVHEQGEARLHWGPLGEVRALARRLREESLLVSLLTRRLLKISKVALLQVQWLYALAGVSGGICRLVVEQLVAAPSSSTASGADDQAGAGAGAEPEAEAAGQEAVLPRLLRAHGRLGKPLASALHALYLFLMADQAFKARVATAYADTYLAVAREYGAGVGVAESSLYSLSVQFLNRPAFVNQLIGCVRLPEFLLVCLCCVVPFAGLRYSRVSTTLPTRHHPHHTNPTNHTTPQQAPLPRGAGAGAGRDASARARPPAPPRRGPRGPGPHRHGDGGSSSGRAP